MAEGDFSSYKGNSKQTNKKYNYQNVEYMQKLTNENNIRK